LSARLRATSLDEAEVPRRDFGLERQLELAQVPGGPPPAQQVANGRALEGGSGPARQHGPELTRKEGATAITSQVIAEPPDGTDHPQRANAEPKVLRTADQRRSRVQPNVGVVKQVELAQGVVRYREHGSGSVLVFVHGLLASGLLWRQVVPPLAQRFRCIVPDWPLGSHELALDPRADVSPPGLARLIADFLAALDLREVTLVGNDTGGALCQMVAAHHPERLSALVLTSCDAFDNFPPPAFRPLVWGSRVPGFLWLLGQLCRLESVRRLPIAYGWLAKRGLDRDLGATYVRPCATRGDIRRDLRRVLSGVSSRYTLEAAEKLRQFHAPVLLAWSVEDRFFPFAHAQRLATILPRATLVPIHDAWTFSPEDQPERLAAAIREFLDAYEEGRARPGEGRAVAGALRPA